MRDQNTQEIIKKAQNGDKNAMTQLIQNNKGLIWTIVKKFQNRGYELEDLYQVAVIGFIKCIKRFDAKFDVRLSTYAVPYVLGEVKKHIRDTGPIRISRSLKELAIRALDIKTQYYKKNGEEIRIEELAKCMQTSKEEITLALEAFQPIYSLDEQTGDENDEGLSLLNKMSSRTDEATDLINKVWLQDAIKNLKEQEKQVILLRYYKGKTQSEIAKILGITQVQVSRIEHKTLENMRTKMAI